MNGIATVHAVRAAVRPWDEQRVGSPFGAAENVAGWRLRRSCWTQDFPNLAPMGASPLASPSARLWRAPPRGATPIRRPAPPSCCFATSGDPARATSIALSLRSSGRCLRIGVAPRGGGGRGLCPPPDSPARGRAWKWRHPTGCHFLNRLAPPGRRFCCRGRQQKWC